MKISQKLNFTILSTLVLILFSPYVSMVLLNYGVYDIIPPTLGQFILLMLLGKASCAILPALYLLIVLLSQKKYYPVIFSIIVTVFLVGDIYFFIAAWPYGLKHQGQAYTVLIALLNVFCFFLIYSLAWQYTKERKVFFIYLANLLLMLTLTFVAFPLLGEMI